MITEKAIVLSTKAREYDDRIMADLFFDELVNNCKPTELEFSDAAHKLQLSAKSLYRLIMEAKDKWSY